MKRVWVVTLFLLGTLLAGCGGLFEVEGQAKGGGAVAGTHMASPAHTAVPPTDTPEPTSTPTLTPTDTPTSTPTAEPTSTPEPTMTATAVSGLVQSELANGDVLYELPAVGFSIALPEEWQAVDLEKMDFSEIMAEVGSQNENLDGVFTTDYMRNLVAAGIKFYAVNVSPDSLRSVTPATINVVQQDLPFALTLAQYVDVNLSQLEQIFDLTSEIEQEELMLGDVPVVRITYTTNLVNLLGQPMEILNAQYLMVDGTLASVVTLSMPVAMADEFLRPFTAAVETFRVGE